MGGPGAALTSVLLKELLQTVALQDAGERSTCVECG
jgi:hypothetical protein